MSQCSRPACEKRRRLACVEGRPQTSKCEFDLPGNAPSRAGACGAQAAESDLRRDGLAKQGEFEGSGVAVRRRRDRTGLAPSGAPAPRRKPTADEVKEINKSLAAMDGASPPAPSRRAMARVVAPAPQPMSTTALPAPGKAVSTTASSTDLLRPSISPCNSTQAWPPASFQ